MLKLKNKWIKFNTIKRLRTTLHFFKANTPFKVKEREKKGTEKHYSQRSVVTRLMTRCGPPCRGLRKALDTTSKGSDQRPPRGVANAFRKVWAPPTYWPVSARASDFFIYQKTGTPLTPHNNCNKKNRGQKIQKYPLTLGKKS
jgi:hypothetical protein